MNIKQEGRDGKILLSIPVDVKKKLKILSKREGFKTLSEYLRVHLNNITNKGEW